MKLVAATIPPARFGRKAKLIIAASTASSRARSRSAPPAGKAIRLVDVYALLDDRADFVDSLHMNDAAYAKVGDAFADALLELLEQPAAAARPGERRALGLKKGRLFLRTRARAGVPPSAVELLKKWTVLS